MADDYPFLDGSSDEEENSDLPLFCEYAWNFNDDCFIYDGDGNHILLTGNDALKIWIYKALKTERYMWLAYSWRFGIELYTFMAKNMGVKERQSEFKRMITECLMVNPYIKSIDSINLIRNNRGEQVNVEITLTTIYGTMTL